MLGTETISDVRDLGIVAWRNDQASLEHMSGPQWKKLLADERTNFNRAARDPDVKERIPAFEQILTEARSAVRQYAFFGLYVRRQSRGPQQLIRVIELSPNSDGGGGWRWAYSNHNPKRYISEDIDIDHDPIESVSDMNVYTIDDYGEGSHDYKLTCQRQGRRIIWSKSDVGPSVICVGDRVYYLRHKKRLWYNQLCSCDKHTGNDERVEYEEVNFRYNLSIVKVPQGFFLRADNNGYSMLFILDSTTRRIRRIDEDAIWHIPNHVIYDRNYRHNYCTRFVLTRGGEWQLREGQKRENWLDILPQMIESYGEPYYYDIPTNVVLSQKNGIAYILRLRGNLVWNKMPIKIAAIPGGKITVDLFRRSTQLFDYSLSLLIESPLKAPYLMDLDDESELTTFRGNYKAADNNEFNRIKVKSADGTPVYAAYVKRARMLCKGLLVVLYGAYGIQTTIGSIMQKWGPLIDAGWAIGFAFVRGGGDDGWFWAEAGRRDQRYKSLEDAEACISGLRRRLRLPAANTVIYGRSAGGIQVGALANRHPRGDLFRGIFCEVPYLDVLQTTTNPSLPLTELEYDEFGDPRHRLADLSFWVRHSPVTNVPVQGLPDIMILCRTGLNDTQVYAYEPLKWILKARGTPASGLPKLLGIEPHQGHFYSGPTALKTRATDLAILDAFIGGLR